MVDDVSTLLVLCFRWNWSFTVESSFTAECKYIWNVLRLNWNSFCVAPSFMLGSASSFFTVLNIVLCNLYVSLQLITVDKQKNHQASSCHGDWVQPSVCASGSWRQKNIYWYDQRLILFDRQTLRSIMMRLVGQFCFVSGRYYSVCLICLVCVQFLLELGAIW